MCCLNLYSMYQETRHLSGGLASTTGERGLINAWQQSAHPAYARFAHIPQLVRDPSGSCLNLGQHPNGFQLKYVRLPTITPPKFRQTYQRMSREVMFEVEVALGVLQEKARTAWQNIRGSTDFRYTARAQRRVEAEYAASVIDIGFEVALKLA